MKKVLIIILILALALTVPSDITVAAALNTYKLSELDLEVTIPSGYSVITRATPASDHIFDTIGTTRSDIISYFESSSIYLNAISDTSNEEIVVTMIENSLSNFSLLSDTVLNTLASSLVNEYTNYGIDVSSYEIYQHSQAKFIKLYFTDTGKTVHGLQYYTIYDGKAMNFTMRSYTGSLSTRQKTAIKTVVDSIKYDNAPPTADVGEETNSFIHTDTDSGVTFTVPANWQQEELTKEREFIDVKFVSTKEDGCIMVFGSTDVWAQMSDTDKIGYTRADLNNSTFSKSDIAEMYSSTTDKISLVTYNGIQYYKGEFTGTQETYGLDFSLTMTQLFYIENGWMYLFQFGGTSDHKLYSDFESLLNSVQYPTIPNVSGVGSSNNTSSGTHNSNGNSGVVAIIVLLIVAVIMVAVVLYRKKKAERDIQTRYTPNYNTAKSELSSNNEPAVQCKICGQALPLDSGFCHKCGTKIVKEDIAQ